jgi:hypothetical protein
MILEYNIESAKVDIVFKQMDTINLIYAVYLNGVLYDMTGMQMDIHFRRKDGLLVKSFSSIGIAPAITIAGTVYNLYSVIGFSDIDVLDYDVQLINGTDILTIQEGTAFIKKQTTT